MSVPGYQKFMYPILEIASDGNEHYLKDLLDPIAKRFSLSEEDRNELLSSGSETKLHNRVRWAKFYLQKANILETPKRGTLKVTERGLGIYKSKIKDIDNNYLNQFPEFVEFISGDSDKDTQTNTINNNDVKTPEEIIESTFTSINSLLAQELLDKIKSSSPAFFERLVVDLLVAMGYGGSLKDAAQIVGKSGDGGIDGIIKEDKLGLDTIYIQAKKWEGTVGRPEVQKFSGSLDGFRAKKGVFITTSNFSKEAHDFVNNIDKKIILIDGKKLTSLMIENDVAVTKSASYTIKKLDLDYFFE